MGHLIGEPILVDEDTLLKRRFDKGRVLVLIPYNQSCLSKMKVSTVNSKNKVLVDGESFLVRLNEDSVMVDIQWMVNVLGLKTSWKEESLNTL